MQVSIKDFTVVELEIKTKGIELEVRDPNGDHRGDLWVTKKKLIWCRGKTSRAKGKSLNWTEFIKMMEKPRKRRSSPSG